MPSYRVISSDNHIVEPPDLWTSRIEPKYRDRCPQLVNAARWRPGLGLRWHKGEHSLHRGRRRVGGLRIQKI